MEQNRVHKINLHIYGQQILNDGANSHVRSLVSSVGSVETSGLPQNETITLTHPTCKKQLKMDYRLSARKSLSPVLVWRAASELWAPSVPPTPGEVGYICKPRWGRGSRPKVKVIFIYTTSSRLACTTQDPISRVWRDDQAVKEVYNAMPRIPFGSQNPGWAAHNHL